MSRRRLRTRELQQLLNEMSKWLGRAQPVIQRFNELWDLATANHRRITALEEDLADLKARLGRRRE